MEILFIILGIGILALIIFIRIKIENAKHRAKQSMLNKVGVGDSNINSGVDDMLEKGKLKKFLENHPVYTDESIKELIKDIAIQIVNKNLTHDAEQSVIDKLAKDAKISKYASMQVTRASVSMYNENAGLFGGKVVFTNNRDEYYMFLRFQLVGDDIKLTKYQMQKGAAVGF